MMCQPGDRVKFIGCEIIHREACRIAAASPWVIDLEFERKGLHDLATADMQAKLREAVDRADADGRYKAILLGYARCNDGLAGLQARSIPLVIPKAHDCITFFFGSRAAYREYFDNHPGTYFHTTGWMERNDAEVPGQQGVMAQLGLSDSYEQLVAKYGEENAAFIHETLGDTTQNYSRICYLEMGVTDESEYIRRSRTEADEKGWQFDLCQGSLSLLQRLLAGPWDDDFLIVPPGRTIVPRNDDEVLGLE